MLDGVVAFDLERYALLPDRLARIGGDLESAAVRLHRSGHPAGRRAAAELDGLAGSVRREQARATARMEQLAAIPGLERFHEWDGGQRARVWDVDWISRDDGDLHSYEELVALSTYQHSLGVLRAVDRGETVEREAVDDALGALAALDDPGAAAALLNLVGAEGFRRLHGALAATTGDAADEGEVRRLEDGIGTLTALFATASRARGRARLDSAFLDGFLGPAEAVAGTAPPSPSAVDAAQRAFAALDFGRDVAERLVAVTGPRGALVVLERAGVPFAVVGAGMPLVDLLQHGPLSPEFAESAITSGLSLAAFLVESAPVSFVLLTGAALVSLIFATADDGGQPPRPVLSPDAPNPGGSHYPLYVDEAGVPAPPGGG